MDHDQLLNAIQVLFEKKMDETRRHMGALVEDLRKELRTVAEGHSVLAEGQDKLKEGQNTLKEGQNKLRAEIAVIKDYVIAVDEMLNEHEVILKKAK